MITFRADPENPARIIAESGRGDEIGTAEVELAAMQRELASMLHQKNRLAALGLAVSKINHDLRNLLASAQLFSDQLSTLPDPKVQRFAPKLMRALERAIAFCQSTLSYGAAQEPPPERKTIEVGPLIEEVHEALGLGLTCQFAGSCRWNADLPWRRPRSIVPRSGQCIAQRGAGVGSARCARSSPRPNPHHRPARRQCGDHRGVRHRPRILGKARTHMFQAFQGSTRAGGAGLGLAIAAELVRAHGGEIRLVPGTIGATFSITIPDRAVDLNSRRGERASA